MKKLAAVFWFGVILGVALVIFFPAVSKYLELKRSEEKLDQEIKDLRGKIRELQKEEYLIRHDQEHLKQVMRSELGLVKPGEVVYKLIPEEVPGPVGENATQPTSESGTAQKVSQ